MDIFLIENSRQQLLKDINSGISGRYKIFRLIEYFDEVLDQINGDAAIPFILEFITHFDKGLSSFHPSGLHPSLVKKLIETTYSLLQLNFLEKYHQSIKSNLTTIEEEYSNLIKSLNGELPVADLHSGIIFPVIEKVRGRKDVSEFYSSLETVSVTIQKTQIENKFVIIPGARKTDEQLITQVKTSWQLALDYSKKTTRKIQLYHNIIIKFTSDAGTFTGNSLGIALTIGFIKEILSFYNAPYLVNIKSGVASTGSVDPDGKIRSVTKEQIEKKAEAIFYSDLNSFVVPEADREYILERVTNLRREFPDRNLKIISAEQFDDVINRRDLVEIKKQPVILRSGKFVKNNWIAVVLSVLIIGMIYFTGWWDFDTNPAILKNKGEWLYVQNKNGKLLWKKRMGYDISKPGNGALRLVQQKLVDINDDGENEILLTREYRIQKDTTFPRGRIVCFSASNEMIWEYYFKDSISSFELDHTQEYYSRIIDTVTIGNEKTIAMFSTNTLYPSAVFFLKLVNGERTGPTLWHVGHLHSGLIGDFNNDGKRELVMEGINNALGRSVIFSIDINNITNAQLPAKGSRLFKSLEFAKVNKYVLLSQSDYDKYYGNKFNTSLFGNLIVRKNLNEFGVFLYEGLLDNQKAIYIQLDNNLNVKLIDPSENFEVARDSLVAQGKLNQAYTHTPEFIQSLWEQLRYWDGETFVK